MTVGGAPVDITGVEALRAAGAAAEGAGDTSVTLLLEVLLAGLGSLIVLAFVFGSFMALVPLLMAAVAVPTTFLLVWPLTTVTDVNVVIQFLVALVGLGIAIDYALLVVMRWREERHGGASNEAAVANAMEHAGRAVVFSGTTVAVALLALVILPVPFLRSIGIAGLFIPLVSVAVALTLLPVVLATVGPRLDWPRGRRRGPRRALWTAWARVVVRHRWAAAIASAAVLLALVGVAFTIQLGDPRAESLAQSGAARAGFEKLADAGHRRRAADAVRGARARRRPRRGRRAARRGRRRAGRRSLRRLAARRHRARHRHPQRGRQLGRRAAPRSTASAPRRLPAVASAGRRRRAPTSSMPSTATSRSWSR